jgi:GH24 family phage-related lysozyme (muramidase)
MKTNRAGVELIKAYESLRTVAYIDPVGIWTIGYGHTAMSGVPHPFKGLRITAEQADDILVADLAKFEAGVVKVLKRVPNENQFSAMVSLAFNIGLTAFAGSTVLRRFNEGNFILAADAFLMWRYGTVGGRKVVLRGLERRRHSERELFLRTTSIPEPIPAPSRSLWAIIKGWFGK